MRIKLWIAAALVVLAIAIALWLVMRGNTTRAATSASPTATGSALEREADRRDRDRSAGSAPVMTATPSPVSAKPSAGRDAERMAPTRAASSTTATERARGAAPMRPPGAGSSDGDAVAGKLTDKTGWSDASVAKQLNKELMPLASECIDQAKARTRGLRGMLSFTMALAPTENGRAIVASLKARPDNQIDDAELFECLRESAFALDGLKAPHDFDITMPIEPE